MEPASRPGRPITSFFPRFRQLRTYLLLLVLCAVAPVVLLVVQDGLHERSVLTGKITNEAMWAARSIARQQESLIASSKRLLATLSSIPEVREVREPQCTETLKVALRSDALFHTIGIADAETAEVVASAVSAARINIADRYYFRKVKETRSFVVGDYAVSRTTGKRVIHFAHPVMEGEKLRGVLYAAYDVNSFGLPPEEADLPEGTTLTVTDRNGTILYTYPRSGEGVGAPLFAPQWTRMTANHALEDTFSLAGDDGIERIHAFRRLGAGEPNGDMFIDVGIPSHAVFAQANARLFRHLLTLAVVSLLALAAAWAIGSRLIWQRARRIALAANQLAGGDPNARVPLSSSPGEFALISKAFNEMAETITRREQALRENEERYRILFESASDAILMLDGGCVAQCNDQALRLFRCKDSEIVGRTSAALAPETQADGASTSARWVGLVDAAMRGERQLFEWRFRRCDGAEFDAEVSLSLVTVARTRYLQAIVRDLSERKRAEAEREALLQELEAKNQDLQSLLYAVSHDLRSPLVNIQGFARQIETMCGSGAAPAEGAGEAAPLPQDAVAALRERLLTAVRFIKASGGKMDTLINGLLRVCRTGSTALHVERLDMNRVLEAVTATLKFQIQEASATIEVAPLPACRADAAHANQIFQNLVDNALKYRDPSRPLHVRISGRVEGGRVVYCVEDNGVGIAKEHQAKIWELFHRLEPLGPVTGEGVGLTLVQRVVERHGGCVWVESEPGKGSRFFVALPKDER